MIIEESILENEAANCMSIARCHISIERCASVILVHQLLAFPNHLGWKMTVQ
jgi:hypothetical protein